MKPTVLCLLGPTASGKSASALHLANRWPVEIITLDSAQVFQGMDIGTAKPTPAERAGVPHHLIDLISPLESYSAARFRADCIRLVADITQRGSVPVIAGGTMLYFKALREGLAPLPDADPLLRATIQARSRAEGWPALHAELALRDPITAARLKPLDAQRIERALEVFMITGTPLSALHAQAPDSLPFELAPIALVPSTRSVLHERIATRFAAMIDDGLVEELRTLRARYTLHQDMTSMRCVGYRQAWDFLEGVIDAQGLLDQGIFATRQLAKRQLTWLRATPGLAVIDCLAKDVLQQVTQQAARVLDEGAFSAGAAEFAW